MTQKKYRPDGKNFELIQKGFQMALNGRPVAEIADFINREGLTLEVNVKKDNEKKGLKKGKQHIHITLLPQSVSKLLANPFFAGIHVVGAKVYDYRVLDTGFLPIISEDDFIKLRIKLESNSNFVKRRTVDNSRFLPLKEMITCNYCKGPMYAGVTGNGKGNYYLRYRCETEDCRRRDKAYKKKYKLRESVRGVLIIDFVFEYFKNLDVPRDLYENWVTEIKKMRKKFLKGYSTEMRKIEWQIKKLEDEISVLTLTLADTTKKAVSRSLEGKINENADLIEDLRDREQDLKKQRDNYEVISDKTLWSYESFTNFLKNVANIVKRKRSMELLDKVVRLAFTNIVIGNGKVVSYKLKPAFEAIEKLRPINHGVEDGT